MTDENIPQQYFVTQNIVSTDMLQLFLRSTWFTFLDGFHDFV